MSDYTIMWLEVVSALSMAVQGKLQRLQQEHTEAKADFTKAKHSAASDIGELRRLAHTRMNQMQVSCTLSILHPGWLPG